MKNNAKTSVGASGLLNALGNEKHGGGILDHLDIIPGGDRIDLANQIFKARFCII